MEILVVVFSWLLFGGATSYFAVQRGRDPFAWFMIGLLLGILGLILLFLLPPIVNSDVKKEEGGEEASEDVLPEELTSIVSYETPFRLKKWFYLGKDQIQKGPFPLALLKREWEQGKLTKNTFVWSEGMSDWLKIEEIPQLNEELS